MLGPKHDPTSTLAQTDEVPDTEDGIRGDGEAELPDVLTPQSLGRIWASSMGLSFAVPGDVDVLAVTAGWGQYTKQRKTARSAAPGRVSPCRTNARSASMASTASR